MAEASSLLDVATIAAKQQKKRKLTQFSPSVCMLPPPASTVVHSDVYSAAMTTGAGTEAVEQAIRERLILADEHELSVKLAEEASSLVLGSDQGVLHCLRVSAGMVELLLQGGDREHGYGLSQVRLRVGGVEEDPATVAIRFASPSPFAMAHVDDIGFFDAKIFYQDLDLSSLSLQAIAQRALELLTRRGGDGQGASQALWEKGREHFVKKVQICKTYRSQFARCTHLVSPTSSILCQEEGAWLVPSIDTALRANQDEHFAWETACDITEASPGIFVFQLFSEAFCDLLLAEVDTFEATSLPRRRPNTMNNYGLILNDVGMEPLFSSLLQRFIAPLCKRLFQQEVFASSIDCHHTFVVEYEQGKDAGLDMHHDASEITMNVCLGRSFQGAGLRFCGRAGAPDHRQEQFVLQHRKGMAVLHLGRHRHGADDIIFGQRSNLIVWARSSQYRAAAARGEVFPDGYPRSRELDLPHELCLSRANDDDFYQQKTRIRQQQQQDK